MKLVKFSNFFYFIFQQITGDNVEKLMKLTGNGVPESLFYYDNGSAMTLFEVQRDRPDEGRHFIRKGFYNNSTTIRRFRCAGLRADHGNCNKTFYAYCIMVEGIEILIFYKLKRQMSTNVHTCVNHFHKEN